MSTRGPGFGAQLAGLSGVALILIMFVFAWYGIPGGGVNGFDAFDAFDDWVGLILIFTAIAGIALGLIGGGEPRVGMPVALSAVAAGLGILSVVVLVIYLISPPSIDLGQLGGEVDLDRKIGLWFGLLAAIGVAAGGWMAMQEEGATYTERERYRRGPRERPGAGPPPPTERPYE
jgi:heme A synthase